jgi:DNA-binding CsgD family transcriptional regulator
MLVFDEEKIEVLISQCRFTEAAAVLAVSEAQNTQDDASRRRLRAVVYALAGDDRGLARVVAPELLACRSAAAVDAYRAAIGAGSFLDDLIAAVVLTWSADATGAYALLRRAHERAVAEGRAHFAVAALERLAHHAVLFGDVEMARAELEAATRFAAEHRLRDWLLRCLAAAARIAFDTGDSETSARLLERAAAEPRGRNALALFAATGAQLAVERRDDAGLRAWTSAEIADTALHSDVPEAIVAAAVALSIGAGASIPDLPAGIALRRALLLSDNAAVAPEFFSMAARQGELHEARLGARALAGVIAPNRRYLRAHRLLARAYLSFRCGKRTWVDHAGDAARAFSAMGLRRWTNEAMLLLVRQEGNAHRAPVRGRPTGSALTDRERQVADLIRRGARNREVAVALQISEHTVERHVSSILGRLGLRSRWQIVDPRKNER